MNFPISSQVLKQSGIDTSILLRISTIEPLDYKGRPSRLEQLTSWTAMRVLDSLSICKGTARLLSERLRACIEWLQSIQMKCGGMADATCTPHHIVRPEGI